MCIQEKTNYLDEIVENIPYKYTDHWDSFEARTTTEAIKLREEFIRKGMFALVAWQWVRPLAKWIGEKRCLEVMAGRGWLSLALQSLGIDIIATDDCSWPEYKKWGEPVTKIEKLDAVEAVKKYGNNIDLLIISWPYMDETAYNTIKKLNNINSNVQIIYIGEEIDGCTANNDFHEHFQEIENEEFQKAVSGFQQWWGLHDRVYLGRYVD